MRRRWTTVVLALAAILALACEEGGTGDQADATKPTNRDLPSSMAALGDSLTTGLGACITFKKCGRQSWSTGESGLVNSHYRRLRAANEAIRGNAHNFAESGARAADLPSQVDKAVDAKVEYVTILIGSNDVCQATVADMTPVADFRHSVDTALDELKSGLPQARVLVASIPDLNRLWDIGHKEKRAVNAWARGVCPTLLTNPTSTAEGDVSRRAAVASRIDAYNAQLAAACKAYGSRCVYDGGAVHRVRFTLAMINRVDWFHPDSDGQEKLADVTYPRRFAA